MTVSDEPNEAARAEANRATVPSRRRHREHTLDVAGVIELQYKLTGTRPRAATIRSYHSRGLMPAQSAPGQWSYSAIYDWLSRRRPRLDAGRRNPAELEAIAQQLAAQSLATRTTGDWGPLDATIDRARDLRLTWDQISRHTGVSPQAEWARYRRRAASAR